MAVKQKISMFCHVEPEQVIFIHDVSSTYRVPILLEEQGIITYFKHRLDLPVDDKPTVQLLKWKRMADRKGALPVMLVFNAPDEATGEDGNQGKHRVTKRDPALSNAMFTLVTSEDLAESVSHTPIQRCQRESQRPNKVLAF
ncbi:unnamed protein product [Ranitomeya imitator]|uniref:CTP synthase 2 n=1 Tax=Ranitomeya imitator TaxID=111125 RepID=A0ABN9L9I2_9NEOB|nr:unnamed protein product [Ranitomeya imitator]